MALSRDEIKEALSQLPVLELVELINELENDWGVSAAAPVLELVLMLMQLRNRLNLT